MEAVRVDYDALICEKKSEDSKTIRKRVELAGQIQRSVIEIPVISYNADLDAAGIKKYCRTGEKEKKFYGMLMRKWILRQERVIRF